MNSFVSCDQTPTDHASDMPPLYSFSERLSHANKDQDKKAFASHLLTQQRRMSAAVRKHN